jgi:hypothetical protein
MTTTNADREWLKRHPKTNFRVRDPVDGELDRLFRMAFGIDSNFPSDVIPPLDCGRIWQVLIIKLDEKTLVRLPVMRPPPDESQEDEGGFAGLLSFRGRITMDRIGG